MAAPRLDTARITDEALKLLQEGGLKAVSLRRIAAGLGAGASTLYWHIRDKDALLTALSQRIFRDCLDAVGAQPGWQDWLHAFGMALWQAQVDIPDVRTLIGTTRHEPAQQRAIMAEIAGELCRLGMAEADAVVAQRSVQALVTGWTTLAFERLPTDIDERRWFERSLQALIDGWGRAAGHG